VTLEAELTELLGRHSESFSVHSGRMRMPNPSATRLAGINAAQRERCVIEVADAQPDILIYGSVAALTVVGPVEHRRVEGLIAEQLSLGGSAAKVRSTTGALVGALTSLQARRIAVISPFPVPLATSIVDCLHSEWFEVVDSAALGVDDYRAIARVPEDELVQRVCALNLRDVDALVISASTQLPSLGVLAAVEAAVGVPVISATTAAAHCILTACDLAVDIPTAGALLAPVRRNASAISP
jgi:maleate isomerase